MTLNTKSKASSTNKLTWNSPVTVLHKGPRPSENIKKLEAAGITTLYDLIWIFPLRVLKIPPVQDFSHAIIGTYFHGSGTITSINARPQFWAKGKGRAMLYNINLVVKDDLSDQFMYLSWFNCYHTTKSKLEGLKAIEFMGEVSEYKSIKQIANPDYGELITDTVKTLYPTVNSVGGTHIQKFMERIPDYLWDEINETLPPNILSKRKLFDLKTTLKTIHGKLSSETDHQEKINSRLVYEEFFQEQCKLMARRQKIQHDPAPVIKITTSDIENYYRIFPYELTVDQKQTFSEIQQDFLSGRPMMRLIQGDVGSGKTTVALMAALAAIKAGHQVALMCPTEALATQHFETFKSLLPKTKLSIQLLIGSTPAKVRKALLQNLKTNEINLIIGTHTLFQDTVEFAKLGLAIIDEQHKFGVEQRLKLMRKGFGTHCLIMTATPIPRSLSLTQYGDLDISTIATMPLGRKGIKTRIVASENFEKFLSFIKTRMDLKEQIYIVVPAIEESEAIEMENLEAASERYQAYFPDHGLKVLHGKMKADEKAKVLEEFKQKKFQVLVSTSVIEVGINILNATVMAILSPERFGLSSLHQLRGRVGRGDKPGFCFLVLNETQDGNPEIMKRLQVLEKTINGFEIAEADLRIRGEGDLFGTNQSGINTKRFANLVKHKDVLNNVVDDIHEFKNSPEIKSTLEKLQEDPKIFATI